VDCTSMDLPYVDVEQIRERDMTENTTVTGVEDDLTEGQAEDNDLIKKLRKQLKDAKAQAKISEEENVGFRETRSQARVDQVTEAVNGLGYPQGVLDALLARVQDADEDEFLSILTDLQSVAPTDDPDPTVTEDAPVAPSPASLGQQVAAAASGGSAVDGVARLAAAKSIDEVNAIAAELGLDQV